MRKAMVVRAGSALGRALIEKLAAQGIETVAISKSNRRSAQELSVASEGVDVIFYGTYLRYDDRPEEVHRMTEAVMEAANQTGAKVIQIQGIYSSTGEKASQTDFSRLHPSILKIQSPELYGVSVKNTYIYYALKKLIQGKPILTLGSLDLMREYLYLPDAVNRIVELASQESTYGQSWNIRSGASMPLRELFLAAGLAIGIKPRFEPIGGWKLRLLQRYDRGIGEILNRYEIATQKPQGDGLIFNGGVPITPYKVGVAETVRNMIRGSQSVKENKVLS